MINHYKIEKACVIAENIEFLLQCPSLKYLEIIPAKTVPDNFDYSKIKTLKSVCASGEGHLNLKNLFSVEHLELSYMKMSDLNDMECNKSLKRLDILKTGIKSLQNIDEFKQLQCLSLSYERRLKDMSCLVDVSASLRNLSIENCPQIEDFSFLDSLSNLEYLRLHGNNKIPDVEFLKRMPKLKTFMFSMEVEDGNLEPCLKVPYVWCGKGKKYYNLKDKDLPKNRDFEKFKLV